MIFKGKLLRPQITEIIWKINQILLFLYLKASNWWKYGERTFLESKT